MLKNLFCKEPDADIYFSAQQEAFVANGLQSNDLTRALMDTTAQCKSTNDNELQISGHFVGRGRNHKNLDQIWRNNAYISNRYLSYKDRVHQNDGQNRFR